MKTEDAVVDMAYFPARDQKPADYCQAQVLGCDVFLGLVGFRYGSPVRDRPELSYTELEFETATTAGIPRLVFLLDERAPVPHADFHDRRYGDRQEGFRQRLQDSGVVTARFRTAEDLETAVLQALFDLRERQRQAAVCDPEVGSGTRRHWMVPRPNGPVVARRGLVQDLLRAVAGGGGRLVAMTTALAGAGGFGKTTLAAEVCGQPEVDRRFPGGVLWVTLGRAIAGADLAAKINDLCEVLSGQRSTLSDPELAGFQLGELLSARPHSLLVVDDVWDRAQLRPFLQGGPGCVRLVTTRIWGVLPADAQPVTVDAMELDEARQLLTVQLHELSAATADRLLWLTGRWPVLLSLVNATIRRMVDHGLTAESAAARVERRLHRRGPAALDVRRGAERDQAVAATVDASLDLLGPTELERYLDLAIFPPNTDIPLPVLAMLWDGPAGDPVAEAEQLCEDLVDLSLVAGYRQDVGTVRLHEVIRAYLRARRGAGALTRRNQSLLEAARSTLAEPGDGTGPAWWSLPDDQPYLWRHLTFHLAEAGEAAQLAGLVTDLRWVLAKLDLLGPVAVEADLALVSSPLAVEMRSAVVRAAHVLTPIEPRGALTDTLLSRLDGNPELAGAVEAVTRTLQRPRLTNFWPLPDQPDPALRRSLEGHAGQVWACLVSPDGSWLASGGGDGAVRVWDSATGMLRHDLLAHAGAVNDCAVSPDGSWLATAGADGTLRIWDPDAGALRRVLAGHTGGVWTCAPGPDGRWLVSAGIDGTVRVWDPATGVERHVLSGHSTGVSVCVVSPGGGWVASGGSDEVVCVWDPAAGVLRHRLAVHPGGVWACVTSPDGDWLAGSGADGTVRIWDPTTGGLRHVVAGSPDGVNALAVAPDGSWLAAVGVDGTVQVCDPRSGVVRRTIAGPAEGVNTCTVSPDGRWLALAGVNGAVQIWEPRTAVLRRVLDGHAGGTWACAAGPNGGWLVTAGADEVVRIWDVDAGRPRRAYRGYAGTEGACAADPAGRWLVTGGSQGTIRIWDPGQPVPPRVLVGHSGTIWGCAASPDGTWFATAGDSLVRIRTAPTGELLRTLAGHSGAVWACAVSPDGSWLVSAGAYGEVRIWDAGTGEPMRTLLGHSGAVWACAVSPDGSWLVSAGAYGEVRIWDAGTGEPMRSLEGHSGAVRACAISADGGWLATAGDDRTVRIWDADAATPRVVLSGHERGVNACDVSPDGRWLATAGADRTVRIWDVSRARCIAALRVDQPLLGCCWLPRHDRLCVVGSSGAHVLTFRPG